MTQESRTIFEDGPHLPELKKRSLTGIRSLTLRQIASKAVFLIGSIVLARLLAPSVFGVFAIVTFAMAFFSTLGDVGIGASLIQKKEEPTEEELSTLFWLQQILVGLVVAAAAAAAPFLTTAYPSLPPAAPWLLRAMALSFAFTALKTIPSILLERKLRFGPIALIDITENVVFQGTAISMAALGFGVWSLVAASIGKGFTGALLFYIISPWRPRARFDIRAVKKLLRFGLPFQGNTLLNFVKSAVTPLFVGIYAGASAVGYLNWARTFATAPLMISESFARVAFPAFSRLQARKDILADAVERSMRSMTMVMFPAALIMAALAPQAVRIIFTGKWLPAIWAFYFYAAAPLFAGIAMPLYSGILSLGKATILLKLSALLVLLEWGLGVPMVLLFGFTGLAAANPVISAFFVYLYLRVLWSEGVHVRIFTNVKWQSAAALTAGLLVKLFACRLSLNIFTLALFYGGGWVIFVGFLRAANADVLGEFTDYVFTALGLGKEKDASPDPETSEFSPEEKKTAERAANA